MTNSVVIAVAGALVTLVACAAGAQTDRRVGCYRADRPLGSSASPDGVRGPIGEQIGEAGPALNAMATFRLLAGGRVDRPGTKTRHLWLHASRWREFRDTLQVELSTMATGWVLTLLPVSPGSDSLFAGEARYLTDVITSEHDKPLRVPVRVRREPCAPPPNEELNLTGELRRQLARSARELHLVGPAGRLTPARYAGE
jgi:hypothetical protein